MPLPVIALLLLLLTGLFLRLRAPSLARKLTPWFVLAALAVPLCQFAASMLWSSFMLYDDEGYVLQSLKDFLSGGSLYDRVYTQYGPFYYLFWNLLSFIGLRPEHLHGRALTLLLWLACSGGCAYLAWRLSRLWFASAATLAGTCIFLWPMASEPSHPGSLVCLLGVVAALLATTQRRAQTKAHLLLGTLAACLLFTKINTGVFLLAALCAGHALALAYSRSGYTWARTLTFLILALFPWLLMRPLLSQTSYFSFAAISSCSLLTVLMAVRPRPPSTLPLRTEDEPPVFIPSSFLLAFCSTSLLILLFCAATGTSLAGLLEGILRAPLRFPNAFTTPILWRPGALLLALSSLPLCLLWTRLSPSPRRLLLTALVASTALCFFLSWSELIELNMQAFLMSYGLSLTWLFCIPLDHTDHGSTHRQSVALILLLQALQAFPVGGSQISWGCVLWIPLCCARASQLVVELPRILPRLAPSKLTILGSSLLLLLLAGSLNHARLASTRFAQGSRLELHGAESLVLPSHLSSALQILCSNASHHANLLYSFPGTYSFNLWTGLPTPTSDNATLWFRLLDTPAQNHIQSALASHPQAVIIRENGTLDYLRSRNIPIEGPLVDYIQTEFTELFSLGSHTFLVHRDRTIAPLGLLALKTSEENPEFEILETTVSTKSIQTATSLELLLLESDSSRRLLSSTGNLKLLSVTPLPAGTSLLRIQIPKLPPSLPLSALVLQALHKNGSSTALARFPHTPLRPALR